MSLWAEINDNSQIHYPTIEEYHDGFRDNGSEQYSRNVIQQNHTNQQYIGIGTFPQYSYLVFMFIISYF